MGGHGQQRQNTNLPCSHLCFTSLWILPEARVRNTDSLDSELGGEKDKEGREGGEEERRRKRGEEEVRRRKSGRGGEEEGEWERKRGGGRVGGGEK